MNDRYSRNINYLRVSLTDKCNLHCCYCMPEEKCESLKENELLTLEEIYRIISLFSSVGIEKVRFTGGEPLLRQEIFPFFRDVRKLNEIKTMSLTTNGTLVPLYEEELNTCGFDQVNISIDTLDRKEYAYITRSDGFLLKSVRKSLDLLLSMNVKVKVNCVPVREINESSVPVVAAIAKDMPIDVRFIELMPLGCAKGRIGIDSEEVIKKIENEFGKASEESKGIGESARYFRFHGFTGRVGVISPMSHKFCCDCSRIRLTPDGILRPCLFHDDGIDMRMMIRNGATDREIVDALKTALMHKPYEHFFNNCAEKKEKRNMNMIGG